MIAWPSFRHTTLVFYQNDTILFHIEWVIDPGFCKFVGVKEGKLNPAWSFVWRMVASTASIDGGRKL